jgi:TP901 family phage tail tape measure protein
VATDKIRQEFIVEAAQAVANLGTLRVALDGVNKSLRGIAGAGAGAAGLKDVTKNISDAEKKTKEFTVSWKTLTRVFATQVIVSVLGRIKRGIAEAAGEAFEFQKQISLIQTLTEQTDVGAGFGDISEAIREISAENNIPIIEAATAAYNAQSNQVGNLSESLRFTAEAAKFSKATNSSLADSVDLLSAGLRSYDLEVTEAGELSALFFTIIDKGRITADEFANSFGRIGKPAAELGVELTELGVAVSVISDKGFKTSETLTQFRGVVNSLSKPTVALKAAIKEIGFEDAQTAVKTLGLVETLRRLDETTEGVNEQFFKLFPNLRGSTGILSILRSDVGELDKTFEAFANSTAAFADEKALIVTSTDAEVVSKALNNLKLIGTDLGNVLLGLARTLVDVGGSLGPIGSAVGETTVKVALLAAGISLLTLGVKQANVALIALGKNPVALGIIAITAAVVSLKVAFDTIDQIRVDRALAEFNRLQEEGEEAAKALDRLLSGRDFDEATGLNAGLKQTNEIFKTITKETGSVLANLSKDYEIAAQGVIRSNGFLTSDLTESANEIVNSRKRIIDGLRAEANSIDSLIKQSEQRSSNVSGELEQRQFDKSAEVLNEAGQVFALTDRSAKLAREAAKTLREAGTDDDQIKIGLNAFKQAESEAKRAESIAKATGNRGLEAQAAEQVNSVLRKQLATEKQLQQLQDQRRDQLREEAEAQTVILDKARKQAALVLENTGDKRADGRQFGADELAERDTIRTAALKELQSLSIQRTDVTIAELLGVGDLQNQINRELETNPITLGIDFNAVTEGLRDALQKAFEPTSEQFGSALEGAATVAGRIPGLEDLADVQTPADAQRLVAALKERAIRATQLGVEEAKVTAELKTQRELLAEALKDRAGSIREAAKTPGQINEPTAKVAEALKASKDEIARLFKEISSGADITGKEIEDSFKGIQEALGGQNTFAKITDAFAGLSPEKASFEEALDVLLVISEKQDTLRKQREQIQQNQGDVTTAQLAAIELAFGNAIDNVKEADLSTSFSAGKTNLEAMEISAKAVETAIRNANGLSGGLSVGSGAGGQQFGGAIHPSFFQTGGLARGVDTVPAVLSPGESVINSRSTSKFFSQLQAMNAGQTPVFRAQTGGNTTVGDINVTVRGGETGVKTARTMSKEIRREIRRGNIN